jgi:hypothetical protein
VEAKTSRLARFVAVAATVAAAALSTALVVVLHLRAGDGPGIPGIEAAGLAAWVRGLEDGSIPLSWVLVLASTFLRPLLLLAALGGVLRARRPRLRWQWAAATLLVLELVFNLSPRSHGRVSLGRVTWLVFHAHHNVLGFRDEEPAEKDPRLPRVLVVGDSFAEGVGLVDVEARFDRVLRTELRPPVEVYNLARAGTSGSEQLALLASYPVEPDLIVWQAFANDLPVQGDARRRLDACRPSLVHRSAALLSFSYLVDFAVQALARDDFEACVEAAYAVAFADDELWRPMAATLDATLRGLERFEVPVVVVWFPFLANEEASRAASGRMAAWAAARGVALVDVATLIEDLEVSERVASSTDSHAGAEVHRRLGRALADRVSAGEPSFSEALRRRGAGGRETPPDREAPARQSS